MDNQNTNTEAQEKVYVEVHNKGKREYKYAAETIKGGKVIPHSIATGESKPIEKHIAEKLMRMFPRDIFLKGEIAIVDVSKEKLEAEVLEHNKTKGLLKQRDLELKGLKEELSKVRTENNSIKAKIEKLEAAIEKAKTSKKSKS